MSVRLRLNDRGAVVRTLDFTVEPPAVTDVVAPEWRPFNFEMAARPASIGGDPRRQPSCVLEYPDGYRGPGSLHAGERVRIGGQGILELLEAPEALEEGERITGWQVKAQFINQLYPLDGILEEMGGGDVKPITFAYWTPRQHQERSGRYDDFDASAPVEFVEDLKANRQINANGVIFKVVEATYEPLGPRANMTLRKAVHG